MENIVINPQAPNETRPVQTLLSSNNKIPILYFVLALCFFTLLMIGGSYFYIKYIKKPMTFNRSQKTLKTYTSKDKKFSLQYPSTYTYAILLPDKKSLIDDGVTFSSPEIESLQSKYSLSVVSYQQIEKNTALKDLAYKKTFCEKPKVTEKEYTLGNKKGLLLEDFTCGQSQNTTFIFVQNKDTLYQIVIRSEKNVKFTSLQPYVEPILKSVQFNVSTLPLPTKLVSEEPTAPKRLILPCPVKQDPCPVAEAIIGAANNPKFRGFGYNHLASGTPVVSVISGKFDFIEATGSGQQTQIRIIMTPDIDQKLDVKYRFQGTLLKEIAIGQSLSKGEIIGILGGGEKGAEQFFKSYNLVFSIFDKQIKDFMKLQQTQDKKGLEASE